jgi:hypothetical protein
MNLVLLRSLASRFTSSLIEPVSMASCKSLKGLGHEIEFKYYDKNGYFSF